MQDSQFNFKIPPKKNEEQPSNAFPTSSISTKSAGGSNPFKFVKGGGVTATETSRSSAFGGGSQSIFTLGGKPANTITDSTKKMFPIPSSVFSDGKQSSFTNRLRAPHEKTIPDDTSTRPRTKIAQPSIINKWVAQRDSTEPTRSASPFSNQPDAPERPKRLGPSILDRQDRPVVFDRIEDLHANRLMSGAPVISKKSFPLKAKVPEPKFHKAKPSTTSKITKEMDEILHSLKNLQRRHCPDDYSRYVILDDRDKLLYRWRAEIDKNSPITGKKIRQGTLNSMCAEKERYVRIVQKRISGYECDENGEINPAMLVKEYSRSAADQEKPLPHELRQPDMLRYTMNYLLKNILDNTPQPDELGGWYNFLWDRTRAIRKEITQLMMSNELAVSLLECCTRFHIVCAYRLCSQDVEKFDQKMNTENLGKSLQTLRHLYEDLAKKGIHCKSEAEFRAYDVLLHLQDSNILRQVLAYRKEVREDPAVRLSIQLACARQTNNYSRFFRLLKMRGTYLQCCICHRFFSQVRSKALAVMNSAYKNTSFNIQYLSNVLGFDNERNALNILGEYGIYPSDKNHEEVEISREHLNTSTEPQLVTYTWIDNKNNYLLSETINGGPVEDTGEIPDIFNSFDESGYYCRDPILETFLKENANYKQESFSLDSKEDTLDRKKPVWFPVVKKPEIDLMEQKAAEEREAKIKKELEEKMKKEEEERRMELARQREVEEQRKRQLQLQQEEQKRQIQLQIKALLPKLYVKIEEEITTITLKRITIEEIEWATKQREQLWTLAQKMCSELVTSVVDKQLRNTIKYVLKTRRREVEEGLSKHRGRFSQLWLKQFWDQWRSQVKARQEARKMRSNAWEEFNPNWKTLSFTTNYYFSNPSKNTSSTTKDSKLTIKQRLDLARFRKKRLYRICKEAFQHWRNFTREKILVRKQNEVVLAQAKRPFSLRRPHAIEVLNESSTWCQDVHRDESPIRKSARLTLEESFGFPTVPKWNDTDEDDLDDSFVPISLEESILTEHG